ncbi:hypothetical protein BOTBODRAFT_36913 [Botryobasidium botryosum FD-172 SS1]|uniref:Zn(2)-C6 fungal-type domain-containing protein n=1 Tax=Botryobasidium botryosum (strain FD-172 SS1) TaxID=930990 RepID=A0A067MC91_BOTB1|nr:hypothetical protein BOTBODRAFT_36913 [Botryobasidium botryosum FD-172 SS1]
MESILVLNDLIPSSPPTKKRVKKGDACTACHTKKRRCNAAKPMCSMCVYDNEPKCVYTILKVKPRTLILQEKINQLEAQISLLQSSSQLDTRSTKGTSPQPVVISVTPPSSNQGSIIAKRAKPLLPRAFQLEINISSNDWCATGKPPPANIITILIGLFTKQEHHHTHDLRPPDFYASLYDPNPDTGLHPALRNTIFLLACGYYPDPFKHLEAMFLRRTMHYMNQSLALADRLLDYLEACTLLAVYYIYKGWLIKGVCHAAAAMSFAAACGLHVLRPPEWHPTHSASLLPPPRSRTEIARRVRVWWMIFTLNRLAGSINSPESDLDDHKIETVWHLPSDLDCCEDSHLASISSLLVRDSKATHVYDDTANVVRCKCVALTGRAARIGIKAASTPKDDQEFWDEFDILDKAIRRIASTLPSMFEEPRFEDGAPHTVSRSGKTNRFIIVPHLFICDAAIVLHAKLMHSGNAASRDACIEACRLAIPVVRQIFEQDMRCSPPAYLTIIWTRMFRVFGLEYNRLQESGDVRGARVVLSELEILSKAIKQRASYFGLTGALIADLKAEFPTIQNELGLF